MSTALAWRIAFGGPSPSSAVKKLRAIVRVVLARDKRAGDGNRTRMTSLEGFEYRRAEQLFCGSAGLNC
jgi:hypothetical protein